MQHIHLMLNSSYGNVKILFARKTKNSRHSENFVVSTRKSLHVIICARNLPNAQKRAHEFNLPAANDDVAAMLDEEKPDVLDIAAPPEVHAELAMLVAGRIIHILCQKPMRSNLKDYQRLVEGTYRLVGLSTEYDGSLQIPMKTCL